MAKGSIKIARKYAKALAELYQISELDAAQAGLKEIAGLIAGNQSLREAFVNPAFKMDERIAVANEIAGKIKPGDERFSNFISLLCQARRIAEIEVISEAFTNIVDEIKKLLSLKVTSAFDVSSQEQEDFKKHIQNEFGSLASVEWDKDADLIGGLQVRAGDKLLDSSIKGALQRLENTLLA